MLDFMNSREREVLTWQDFGIATRSLAQMIYDSGWMPDLVLAVARGGLLPGGSIAYALGIKAVGAVNVEFYTDIAQTLSSPVLIPPLMDMACLAGKKVLVADDVADSGKTLKLVMDLISTPGRAHSGQRNSLHAAEVRCATIYRKSRSVITPDYVWRKTDKWINFPWSTLPPVGSPSKTGA